MYTRKQIPLIQSLFIAQFGQSLGGRDDDGEPIIRFFVEILVPAADFECLSNSSIHLLKSNCIVIHV